MSALGQKTLIALLIERDALELVAREGLDPECVPHDDLRRVMLFSLDYFHQSGRTKAPSEAVLRVEFGDLFEDHEIDFDNVDETIEWALDDLKGTFVHKQVATMNKALAKDMSEADNAERVTVAASYASQFVALSMRLESREQAVDIRTGMRERLDAYEARALTGNTVSGMTFNLPMVDTYTGGIRDGELAVAAAGPKVGKALAVGTRVLTPTGWQNIESLRPGDQVLGSAGPTTVQATARWTDRPLMRVVTDDGGQVTVDAEHDWTVRPHSHAGREQVVDTATLAQKILTNRRFAYLPLPEPVQYAPAPGLPLDPYLLGLLLGDGGMTQATVTFTSMDAELHAAVRALVPAGVTAVERGRLTVGLSHPGRRGNALTSALRDLGVMGCRSEAKFVPECYMQASATDRLALLQGLLDTDGGVDGRGITFCSTSPRLARQVQEIVWSLGGTARIREKTTGALPAHVVRLRLAAPGFRLTRKIAGYAHRDAAARVPSRRIVEVTPAGVGDTVCIQVAAPDSLFLTEDFLLTHNSYFCNKVAKDEHEKGRAVCLFTLENSVEMAEDRTACLALGIDPRDWDRGVCTPEQVARVREWVDRLEQADVPLWIVQPPPGQRNVESMVREAQLRGAQSLIIDQLTFIEVPDERLSRTLQIRDVTHSLKSLISTGRDKLPCLLAHQISREGVKAADKVGYLEMYHLAESSEVERTADWVFGLYRSKANVGDDTAMLQTLAARRAPLESFSMTWDLAGGIITADEIVRNLGA